MKKLYRSKSNQMLCGVCAGIGEYTNVDANVIRLILQPLLLQEEYL